MSTQLPDVCRRKHGGDKNSEAANALVHSRKKVDRQKILAYADFVGSKGITLKEVVRELKIPIQSASARLSELKADAELVPKPTGEKREGCGVFIRANGQLSLGL